MKKTLIYLILFIFIISISIASDSKSITLNLEYGPNQFADEDNNGIEYDNRPIDFIVSNSIFSWTPKTDKLCTLWEITDIETSSSYNTCMGSPTCCNFVDTVSMASTWDEPFYLQYNIGGASHNNKVTATIIYLDYSFSPENTYSEIAYSEKDYLYGVFSQPIRTSFSTADEITIYSPDNLTTIESGENVYLNFTLNETRTTSYSIDNSNYIQLGNGTDFTTIMSGDLDNNIFSNQLHTLNIFVMENESNFKNYTHSFLVNDITEPKTIFTHLDNPINNSNINTSTITIKITSDEYTKISYILNSDSTKEAIVDNELNLPLNISNTNTLWVNSSDIHGNYKIDYLYFNLVSNPTCTDNIQNGNEEGIDCGGSCNSCIPFNISMEKSSFNLSESIKVTVLSRENSQVNLSLFFNNNIIYQDLITSYSPGFPIFVTKPLANINDEGNYLLHAKMTYINNTEEQYLTFYVEDDTQNPLSVIINSNATTIDEGESIQFTATVSGTTNPVTYAWKFHDSTSTSSTVDKTYSTNGSFQANLTISQNEWTAFASKTITVRKLLNITVLVVDDSDSAIVDAIVEVEDEEKNTTNTGITSFLVNPGNIDLDISKNDYKSFSNITNVQQDTTIKVQLNKTETDSTPPEILLTSPSDDSQFSNSKAKFKYKVKDKSKTDCTLYLSIDDSWWTDSGSQFDIYNEDEKSFSVDNLENRAYQWKIECTDKKGNSKISETRSFVVNSIETLQKASSTSEDSSIDLTISDIDSILANIKSLGKEEKDVAIALDMEKSLEKAKKELERAKRDLHNLVWRRVNTSDMDVLREEILDKISSLRDTVPKSLTVINSDEFIQYPDNEEISDLAEIILESDNKKTNKKDIKKYAKELQDMQKKVSIGTKYYIVDITYLSGKTSRISIIEKNPTSKKELKDYSIVESIPKSIAESTDKLTTLFDFSIIKEDPIIRLDNPLSRYTYFVEKELTLPQIKEIVSIIVLDSSGESNSITGFSILTNIPKSLIETNNLRLIIEIIIIIALIIVYLAFSGNFSKLIFTIKHFKSLKEIKEVRNEINKGIKLINEEKYDESKKIYQDVNKLFKDLPKTAKKDLMKRIKLLAAKLNVYHMNKLLDKAEFHIEGKKNKEAAKIYNQVSGLYNVLPKKYKETIIKRCKDLHETLNVKKK